MKTNQLIELRKQYGNLTLDEIIAKQNKPFQCPKCNGKGFERVEYNGYPDGLPDSGWVYQAAYKDVMCKICDGEGYTKNEIIAKTETKVIGYETK